MKIIKRLYRAITIIWTFPFMVLGFLYEEVQISFEVGRTKNHDLWMEDSQ